MSGRAAALSDYDQHVPHPPEDPRLAERFAALRERRPAVDLAGIRDVVIVVSSSRSGCTLLGELLRRCESLLALPAESNPYVVVAQLGAGDPAGVVAGELARVIGSPAAGPLDEELAESYGLEWAWRLTAQWPALDVDIDTVVAWAREALATAPDDLAGHILGRAAARDARVDPRRYDIPREPGVPAPEGPPGDLLVEMPPFVIPRPWRLATEADVRSRPLVLATPRNGYRVAFLAGLFPASRVRVVHLLRNPGASVNGLVDGWLHHGFFNCRMPRELAIRGYSDRGPWGRSWWNYDVPPGWEDVVDAALPQVCALQWRAAHEAALDAVDRLGLERHRLRYEDLVGAPEARERAARGLAEWLGIPAEELVPLVVGGLDPVMATAPPRPGRWRAREAALADVLADPRTLAVAERLGYDADPATWA